MKQTKPRRDISPRYLFLALTVICVVFLVFSIFFKSQTRKIRSYVSKIIVPLQEGIDKAGDSLSDGLSYFGDV
ncbi:MAG TPA: hypothetical protein DEO87_02325, partial [Lachnospiraceae bacterium]|nr:hypothetical protein [Lachnospiraceae bacterium]